MKNKEPKRTRHTTLIIDGTAYKTQIPPKYKNRTGKDSALSNPKLITAFIPGTILEVKVKPGKDIKKGEPLLVLEAMKMNNIIRSSVNGKVKKIHCKKGDLVSKSQLLVELE